ncbi:putative aldouronate transport system substrate-binding protein [Eubacterium ruminantium]|jgi:putative aldouronate transport system substrate-binding protein|uniref:Putative aldouronate transport system substrate-binding protein n=1 Tax=Eubacterium ruminantium TaxID=42322 RepID=A0A1T4K3R4_9FIRM|nr:MULTISPECIES: sugar ABC transporter substrate-binding protein [Eubacterium]MCR5367185.1 sugar ABC transporter substrate-binding protein [Eubacterium sp.]SCW27916.1 putative aldouronate transport system substrate-binding protein [Eubacterium ruminantium]SDM13240.1 putative aldouronate transport system substrate-binding protein [Eubacterium ruminantium]SJZ36993.1 putative aldouronate transport system substrate-binding protein [Eubacterium ruminantium]
MRLKSIRKVGALGLAMTFALASMGACGKKDDDKTTAAGTSSNGSTEAPDKKEVVNWDMFIAMPGAEIDDGNEIQEIIAEKTGVKVKETWLTGQTAAEAVGTLIAGDDLPVFIDGGDGMAQLYDEECLIAWDDYLDKYPNLKGMYTDEEWNMFRQADGKIYWANIFQNTKNASKATTHNDEAFWVQCRVLEWAGYPKIETLDEYFDLLEKFAEANPKFEGADVIPYTMLCDDWRYFCIENAPEFLDGYPNDGSVIVNQDDPKNPKIVDYNTTPTAKRYFQKLNEEYHKGIIDKEFATRTYDEYIAALSTGSVLGMCDQWWDFAFTVNDVLKQQGLDEKGCNYVPLGLTIDKGMDNRWHTYGDTLNNSSGVGITKKCKDPDRAFAFLDQLLDEEIHNLRFWGVEGKDYLVDDNGLFYRTQEMRDNWSNSDFKAKHVCAYSYLPQYGGTSDDGKNALRPEEQPSEFLDTLATPLRKCFEAYNVTTYPEMIGSVVEENAPWFPMYSYSNAMTTATAGGTAFTRMGEVKHEHLPKVVMADDFEAAWDSYMKAYSKTKPEDFLAEMQEELDKRAGK